MSDRTCLSYWFPILDAAGVPGPRTAIILHDQSGPRSLMRLCDGVRPFSDLCSSIVRAGHGFGWPIFLRTGLTSGKHEWRYTCRVCTPDDVPKHVAALVEHSELADILGLPTDVWVVRELLDLDSRFTAFQGMPVAREIRCFVEGGKVVCAHPYWPQASLEGNVDGDRYGTWRCALAEISDLHFEHPMWTKLARRVADLFKDDGAWSVDICRKRCGGWLVTDMAEAEKSFHWAGCESNRWNPEVAP